MEATRPHSSELNLSVKLSGGVPVGWQNNFDVRLELANCCSSAIKDVWRGETPEAPDNVSNQTPLLAGCQGVRPLARQKLPGTGQREPALCSPRKVL
jgi:hypothetical protein